MTLTHILVESRTLLQKAMTELQNNEHKRVCWLGNYETKLCKQNKYIISKLMKKQGIWNKVIVTATIKIVCSLFYDALSVI
jgi:hypothetical protein